ncbi:MAG: mycothiol conjugate amidase Mca [Actinomycetia bacterium]|nr:mycothiol conjugate amidase Mca [Actinomycetes bacterium]MCP4226760.1 mycothiol conjugate amidase Mca [Actinomycetes bacterium]MCP5035228.1 mycothiol conjugate amidase Mca [Actinomycetes bacterium]
MARLLCVHAHPDDEASKGAPTVARYVDEGHAAYLVCATGGEEGDILNKALDRPEVRNNLPRIRAEELNRSVKAIGYHELVWLGYRDSGMPDSDANVHPGSFAQADLDEATGRLVGIIRRLRPHVIITYSDDQQGYRHPDHLRVHDVSLLAWERAGDPGWYPDQGEGWEPLKLYYSVWSRARLLAHHEKFTSLGLESPYDDRWFKRPSNDDRITSKIDIGPYYSVRREALLAHATQVDPNEKFWFGLPDDAAAEAYPWEDYILAHSRVSTGALPELDLFEGVPEASPVLVSTDEAWSDGDG